MKKKTKQWIKENLINYLNSKNLTITQSSWGYKKGIGSRSSNFKEHYDSDIEDYLSTKFHLQFEEEETKRFFDYLWERKQGNEDMLLEFLKSKSPANKTKVEKNGTITIENSSNDHSEYQKYMAIFLKEENLLLDYMGNLRFLGGEQSISFDLIKNVFTQEKKEVLIEMYLNSNLMKNTDFERRLYDLVELLNLKNKYIGFFPNLKEGKKDFDINDFEHKKTQCFIIKFDKDTLVKQIEIDKSMDDILKNINNIVNLEKIKNLNIESINIVNDKDTKQVIILGDDLNISYINIAISEYMRIALKEEEKSNIINKFVNASKDFDTNDTTWNEDYKTSFIYFKERIEKIKLKEKLDRVLVKDNVTKDKKYKI